MYSMRSEWKKKNKSSLETTTQNVTYNERDSLNSKSKITQDELICS